jgi:hypothetical protein
MFGISLFISFEKLNNPAKNSEGTWKRGIICSHHFLLGKQSQLAKLGRSRRTR